jgi:hypothetical protein
MVKTENMSELELPGVRVWERLKRTALLGQHVMVRVKITCVLLPYSCACMMFMQRLGCE